MRFSLTWADLLVTRALFPDRRRFGLVGREARPRRVIPLAGAHFDASAAGSRNFYAAEAVGVPRVHGNVSEAVLRLPLLADAPRSGDELAPLASLVHIAPGLRGEAPERVLAAETGAMDPEKHFVLGIVHGRDDADGVDWEIHALRLGDGLIDGSGARGVDAVGRHHDRPPPEALVHHGVGKGHHGIVESGRAEGLETGEGRDGRRLVLGEVGQLVDVAIESVDRDAVLGPAAVGELERR